MLGAWQVLSRPVQPDAVRLILGLLGGGFGILCWCDCSLCNSLTTERLTWQIKKTHYYVSIKAENMIGHVSKGVDKPVPGRSSSSC